MPHFTLFFKQPLLSINEFSPFFLKLNSPYSGQTYWLTSTRQNFICNNCLSRAPYYLSSWGDPICVKCGSTIRSRLFAAILQYVRDFSYHVIIWNKSILHLAPDDSLRYYIQLGTEKYQCADYDPSRYKDAIHIDLASKNSQSFPDHSVDVIIALDVLEHVPNFYQAIFEIKRILNYNGVLILSVPQPFGLFKTTELVDYQNQSSTLIKLTGIRDHLRVFGDDLDQILRDNFSKVESFSRDSFPPHVVKMHLLDPSMPTLNPHGTRDRKIFICTK